MKWFLDKLIQEHLRIIVTIDLFSLKDGRKKN